MAKRINSFRERLANANGARPSLFAFKRKYLCIPYFVFLVLFIIIPILIIVAYAFMDDKGAFSLEALSNFFTSEAKIRVLVTSVFIALQTTLLCLLIGYPLAYFLANKKYNKNRVIFTLFIAPMWINFVLRTGATRDLLTWFYGLFGTNTGKLPYTSTLIGMVYNYLPFAILPLYTTMLKLDKSQIEAAADLGANPTQVFLKSILPQSIPGIISACSMTFMPTMSSYVISDILSEAKITLFGNYIYLEYSQRLWNDGSFMALIMLIIIGISMFLTRNSDVQDARGSGVL